MKRIRTFFPAYVAAVLAIGSAQTTELAAIITKSISRNIDLPGEFQPFQSVSLHSKIRGYVERV